MIKIALVAESINDRTAIKYLLLKKFSKKVQFSDIFKNVEGDQLDNPKTRRNMPLAFKESKCKFVLYIRDSDGIKTDEAKITLKKKWFENLDAEANKQGILLLSIWELEAMILADIATFNRLYKTKIKFTKDPMMQVDPKEFLMDKTANNYKKYQESHCPDIFEKLNFATVVNNCQYFREFISEFEKKIK